MALYVLKFGGTSVGSIERIEAVADQVLSYHEQGHQIVVVVSAMSGETNRLTALAQAMKAQPTPAEMDVILATGEQVTTGLLAMALHKRGLASQSMTGDQAGILTDEAYSKARIQDIDGSSLQQLLANDCIPVVAGFQGRNGHGRITTLGRGGSDTTAVALAAALKADECRIYTDVDGVYTTDPRIEPRARKMDTITFEEMLELASLGAKVLQIRAVEFAGKYNVPLRVLSSFSEGEGTLITYEEANKMEAPLVSGIASNRDQARITLLGIPHRPAIAASVLGPIGRAGIEVDMIIQNLVGENRADFTFTLNNNDLDRAQKIVAEIAKEIEATDIRVEERIAKISVVGVGMHSHAGVASTVFESLGNEGINIELIATSEIKISVVVDEKYMELAVRTLHAAFELDKLPTRES